MSSTSSSTLMNRKNKNNSRKWSLKKKKRSRSLLSSTWSSLKKTSKTIWVCLGNRVKRFRLTLLWRLRSSKLTAPMLPIACRHSQHHFRCQKTKLTEVIARAKTQVSARTWLKLLKKNLNFSQETLSCPNQTITIAEPKVTWIWTNRCLPSCKKTMLARKRNSQWSRRTLHQWIGVTRQNLKK